jgi:hypothetical protein
MRGVEGMAQFALAGIVAVAVLSGCGHTSHQARCSPAAAAPREQEWTTDGHISAVATRCSTIFVGGTFTSIGRPTGAVALVDPVSGRRRPFPRFDGWASSVVPDGHGGWFVAGSFDAVDGRPCHALVHVDRSSKVDWCVLRSGTAGALTKVADSLYVAADPGGSQWGCCARVLAFDLRTRGAPRWRLTLGTRNLCYASGNCGDTSGVGALAVRGGTLYVGGYFGSAAGKRIRDLAAVDAASGRVLDWDAQLRNERTMFPHDTVVESLAVVGETLYVGGAFTRIGGAERTGIAALSIATARATPWHPRLRPVIAPLESAQAWVGGIVATPSRVFVAAYSEVVDGFPLRAPAAIDPANGRVLPWRPSLAVDHANGPDLELAGVAGHSLYVLGSFTRDPAAARRSRQPLDDDAPWVAAVDTRSGRVRRWRPAPNGAVTAVAVARNGVVIGGAFTSVNVAARDGLAAIDGRRARLLAWRPHLQLSPRPPEDTEPASSVASLLATDRTLYVGGAFFAVDGQARRGLAAFDLPSLDLSLWRPRLDNNPGSSADALALVDDTLYVAGSFHALNGQPRHGFGAVSTKTARVTGDRLAFSSGRPKKIFTLHADHDTVYAGGEFAPGVVAFDRKTHSIDWSAALPAGSGTDVKTLAAAEGSLFAGGQFVLESTPLVRLDPEDGRALTFRPRIIDATTPAYRTVDAAVTTPAGLYFAGTFTAVSGEPRNGIALLDPATARVRSWTLPSCGVLDSELDHARVLAAAGDQILTNCVARAARRTFNRADRLVVADGAGTR